MLDINHINLHNLNLFNEIYSKKKLGATKNRRRKKAKIWGKSIISFCE